MCLSFSLFINIYHLTRLGFSLSSFYFLTLPYAVLHSVLSSNTLYILKYNKKRRMVRTLTQCHLFAYKQSNIHALKACCWGKLGTTCASGLCNINLYFNDPFNKCLKTTYFGPVWILTLVFFTPKQITLIRQSMMHQMYLDTMDQMSTFFISHLKLFG